MKTIIKVVVVIALLSLCVYIEDYVQRCAAMFVGAGIAVVGLAVGDKTDLQESWRDFIATLGVLLYFGFSVLLQQLDSRQSRCALQRIIRVVGR